MKTIFKNFLNKEIEKNQAILAQNSISDEDKAVVESAIASLQETLEAVEAAEDDATVEELKTTVGELQESLTAIKEKLNQETKTQPEMENITENYLKSANAMADFAQTIRDSKTGAEFAKKWADVLAKNGITIASGSEEAYLPEPVRSRIMDAWDRENQWLSKLNNTGAKRFYARYNNSDQTEETSRAKGWKKGDTKVGQSLTMAAKLLEPQFIYKIQSIDNQTIFENDTDLINYVIDELINQIAYELRRAVLVGDGRAVDSDYKINKIAAVARTTTDAYVTVSTVTANGFLIDDLRAMVDGIKNDTGKEVLVFMSKADLRTVSRVQASETSTPVYMAKEQVAEQIGENVTIITTDLLGSDYKAIAMIPSEYYMVGENILNPKMAQWEDYMKNVQNWRMEIVAGGDVVGLKSAAVLKAE